MLTVCQLGRTFAVFTPSFSVVPVYDNSDLVHTTESLRNTKMNAGKTEKESRNLDALLEPYKTENARIVRENNELHSGLLKLREEKDLVGRGIRLE